MKKSNDLILEAIKTCLQKNKSFYVAAEEIGVFRVYKTSRSDIEELLAANKLYMFKIFDIERFLVLEKAVIFKEEHRYIVFTNAQGNHEDDIVTFNPIIFKDKKAFIDKIKEIFESETIDSSPYLDVLFENTNFNYAYEIIPYTKDEEDSIFVEDYDSEYESAAA